MDIALETLMPVYRTFFRRNIVYKINELLNKRITLTKSFIFPRNSVFHFLDNISINNGYIDVPNLDNYEYFQNKIPRKRILHNKSFPTEGIFALDDKVRFYKSGLQTTLFRFTQKYRDIIKPISNIDEITEQENILYMINHNPLFRIKTRGIMKEYDRFYAVINSVFDSIANTVFGKYHFISIKVNKEYFKNSFMTILNNHKITQSTLRDQNNYYYFLLHMILFLVDNKDKLSIFSKLNPDQFAFINIIFYNDKTPEKEAIIYNLQSLISIVHNPQKVWQFLAALNGLYFKMNIEDTDKMIEITTTATDATDKKPVAGVHKLAGNTTADVLNKIATNSKNKITSNEKVKINKFKIPEEPKEFDKYLDQRINNFLDRQTEITPAQKTRALKLAKTYKNIKVNINGKTKTISEVVKNRPNDEIEEISFNSISDKLIDKSMIKSKITNYDKQYMDKFFYYDLFQNLLAFQSNGLFLIKYDEKDERNEINRIKHIKVTYETAEGKRHTLKFKLPIPDDEGYFLINSVKTKLSKQLVNKPISKISESRVSLVSNYNKELVDRVSSSSNGFKAITEKELIKRNIPFSYKNNNYTKKYPYDYSTLGRHFGEIDGDQGKIYFDRDKILDNLKLTKDDIKKSKKYGLLIGKSKKYKNAHLFITDANKIRIIDINSGVEYEKDKDIRINDIIFGEDASIIKTSREFCILKILDQNIPVVFILAYRIGFSKILDLLNVKYRIIDRDTRGKLNIGKNENVIRFKNKYFIFNKYPLKKSLILNGLFSYPTLKNYDIEEFDSEDVFYELLLSKGQSINYLKGINNFFDFFIDPITRDVLQQMGEPTDTINLLIRAVEMLVTDDHEEASSTKNLRIRSFERLNSMIYNEISRQYANFISSKYREKSFSINTEAIFQRIIQDQSNILAENINPVHSIKENERLTYVGFGGRSSESFVTRDRKFPEDGIGILSEATPDSGNVSINTFTSGNPGIKNLRGMFEESPDQETANILSTTALLMPGATNDDPKRANFINIQLSHHVPSDYGEPSRIRTGYEKVIPYKTSNEFAFVAKDDGKVIDIDKENSLLKIQYKNKDIETIKFGETLATVSGSYFKHKIVLNKDFKIGSKFKKDDILSYHLGFFNKNNFTDAISWNHGVTSNVAFLMKDVTLEDGCDITKEFSKKLSFNAVELRPIKITSDMVIKQIVKEGQEIKFEDNLCTLEFSDIEMMNINDIDSEGDFDDIIDDLKSIRTKAKHNGKIMRIDIFRTCELEEMHPQTAKIIRSFENKKKKIAKFAKGSISEDKFTPPGKVPLDIRIKGQELGENTILICFYIEEEVDCGIGDKLVFDSSLKTVISNVSDNAYETESGKKIDALFNATGVNNRIILSVIKTGILNRVVKKIEQNAVDIYFG